MTGLTAGLCMLGIVDTDDHEVGRRGGGDAGQRTEIHQQFTITGDRRDADETGDSVHDDSSQRKKWVRCRIRCRCRK